MSVITDKANEIVEKINSIKQSLATAVTGKGVATSSTDSFSTIATNITNIPSGGSGGDYSSGDIITLDDISSKMFFNLSLDVGFSPTAIAQSDNLAACGSSGNVILINKQTKQAIGVATISNTTKEIIIDEKNLVVYVISGTTSKIYLSKFNIKSDFSGISNIKNCITNSSTISTSFNYKDFALTDDKLILFGVNTATSMPVLLVNLDTLAITGDTFTRNGVQIKQIFYIYKWDKDMTVNGATRIYAFNDGTNKVSIERNINGTVVYRYTTFFSTSYKYSVVYDEINDVLYTYYSSTIYKYTVSKLFDSTTENIYAIYDFSCKDGAINFIVAPKFAFASGDYLYYFSQYMAIRIKINSTGIFPDYVYNTQFSLSQVKSNNDMSNVLVIDNMYKTSVSLMDFTKICKLK